MSFQCVLLGLCGLGTLQACHCWVVQGAVHAQNLGGHGADGFAQCPLRHIAAYAYQRVDDAYGQCGRTQIHLGLHHHVQVDGFVGQGDFSAHFGIGHAAGNGQIVCFDNASLDVQAAVDAVKGKAFFGYVSQARKPLQAQQADEFERPGVNAADMPAANIHAQLASQGFHVERNGRAFPPQSACHAALAGFEQVFMAEVI